MAGIDLPTTLTLDRGDKVPAWTEEDELNLRQRMLRVGYTDVEVDRVEAQFTQPDVKLVRRPKPPTAVTFAVDLVIDRAGRHRCPECRLRRELFAIAVTGHAFGASEPRCAACWGFR